MQLRHSAHIPASPEDVWSLLGRPATWPGWTPTVTAVRTLDGPDLVPGARFALSQPFQRERIWTVTEADPGRSFRWRTDGASGFEAAHRIEPDGAGGCLSRAELIPFGGARRAGPVLGPILRLALAAEARGLRRACLAGPAGGTDRDVRPRRRP